MFLKIIAYHSFRLHRRPRRRADIYTDVCFCFCVFLFSIFVCFFFYRGSSSSSSRFLETGDGLLRGVVEVLGGDDRQSALGHDLLRLVDVGTFEPDDQRHSQVDALRRCRDPVGDRGAVDDPAEDVHQYGFHCAKGEGGGRGVGRHGC